MSSSLDVPEAHLRSCVRAIRRRRARFSGAAPRDGPLMRPLVAILALVLLGCGGDGAQATASKTVDRFDGARAFTLLRHQVEMGPRPAGSIKSRELASWARK